MLYLVALGSVTLSLFLMKVLKTLFVELKSNALICHVRIVLVS